MATESVIELFNNSPLGFTCENDKRIYMFDLDSTLIYDDKIPQYVISGLKAIAQYPIVIFTNQLGISLGKCTIDIIIARIKGLIEAIGINPYVFVAIKDDKYRKPHTGMFRLFVHKYLHMRSADAIKQYNMIFCGDAAGREADFSDSDRKFALNCGIDFITPELFFKQRMCDDEYEKYTISGFNPKLYIDSLTYIKPNAPLQLTSCEMIIMVGPPSCGKSTFTLRELYGYVRVNQDMLKTRQKCLKTATWACERGLNVVIDNTNPSIEVRKQYIDIATASKYKYNIRCIYMNVSVDLAQHLSAFRAEYGGKAIPAVAYGKYIKNFEYPTQKEGFSRIDVLDFIPNFNPKQLKKFTRFY